MRMTMRRGGIIAATVLGGLALVMMATTAWVWWRSRASTAVASWGPILRAERPDGELSQEAALRAFTLYFGEPQRPSRRSRRHAPFCGSEALRQVYRHWDTLSEPQRDRVVATLQRYDQGAPALGQILVSGGDSAQRRAAVEYVSEAIAALQARLGIGLQGEPVVRILPGDAEGDLAFADGFIDGPLGVRLFDLRLIGNRPSRAQRCRVTLGVDLIERARPQEVRTIVGHEVFHCFQHQLFAGTVAQFYQRREQGTQPGGLGWIVEGTAAWAGNTLGEGPDRYAAPRWDEYFTGVDGDGNRVMLPADAFFLFQSFYPAFTFWDALHRGGHDLWAMMPELVNAPSAQAAYARALRGVDLHLVSRWTSGALRRRGWDPAWYTREGTGLTDAVNGQRVPTEAAALRGDAPEEVTVGARPGVQRIVRVPIALEAVAVVEAQVSGVGHVTLQGREDYAFVSDGTARWCVRREGCACPPGQRLRGAPLRAAPGVAEATVAVLGGPGGNTRVVLSGTRLDRFLAAQCEPDTAPPPTTTEHDPCLVGTWHIDRANELARARRSWPREVTVTGVRGDLTLRFDARGQGEVAFRNYCVETRMQAGVPLSTRTIFNGGGAGAWRTASQQLYTDGFRPAVTVTAEVTLNGQRMTAPVPAHDAFARAALPHRSPYSCSEGLLVLRQGAETILYRR